MVHKKRDKLKVADMASPETSWSYFEPYLFQRWWRDSKRACKEVLLDYKENGFEGMTEWQNLPSGACNSPEASIQPEQPFSSDDGFDCVLHCQTMELHQCMMLIIVIISFSCS